MGTLGCVNDMIQRDKENRELRKWSRDRMRDTRNRLMQVGKRVFRPGLTVEKMDEILKNTKDKERADSAYRHKATLLFLLCALVLTLVVWFLGF